MTIFMETTRIAADRVKDDQDLPNKITLRKVRNCIYWHSSIGGFLELASVGPNKERRHETLRPLP